MKGNIYFFNLSARLAKILIVGSLALLIIAFYLIMVILSFSGKSAYFDEPAHLASGYFMLKHQDYRVGTSNMVFSQKMAALSLLFSGVKDPDPALIDKALDGKYTSGGEAFGIGMLLLNDSGNDSRKLLFMGRIAMLLFGLIAALSVFFWSNKLFGPYGGLISLSFLATCPVFISLSGIIGADIVAATLFLLTVWSYWVLLHRITPLTCMLFALTAGLLLVTKMSSLLFGPVAVILLLIRILVNHPLEFGWGWKASGKIMSREKSALAVISGLLVSSIIILVVIWSCYGFRYSSVNPSSKGAAFNWEVFLEKQYSSPHDAQSGIYRRNENTNNGALISFVRLAKSLHLLPEAFLFDLASLSNLTQSRMAFFLGETSTKGWTSYFPLCFLSKSGLPFIIALIILSISCLVFLFHKARSPEILKPWRVYECLPIFIFIMIYMAIIMFGSINVGHRHMLPIYPFIYVLLGAFVFHFRVKSLGPKIILCLLIVSSFVTAIGAYPYHLAYISPLFGGTNMGYRYFADSSIEWGQELPAVKKWIDTHQTNIKGRTVYFSYFGSGSPEKEGIKSLRLPGFFDPLETSPQSCTFLERLKPGLYLISATMLQPVYYSRGMSDGTILDFSGPWCRDFEEKYLDMKKNADELYDVSETAKSTNSPGSLHDWMIKNIPSTIPEKNAERYWLEYLALFDLARFARLASFLRRCIPDGNINYSVYVFLLDENKLEMALNERF